MSRTKNKKTKQVPRKRPSAPPKAAGLGYTKLAYLDYAAARSLLLADHYLVGLSVASTAIEKYFKAILLTQGLHGKGHLGGGLVQMLTRTGLDIVNAMNADFIAYLGDAYAFRYADNIQSPTSLVIEPFKVLAELDQTIHELDSRLTLTLPDGSIQRTEYRDAVKRFDPTVWNQNCVLLKQPKKDFVERIANTMGVYVEPGTPAFYVTIPRKPTNDERFVGNTVSLDNSRTQVMIQFVSPETPLTQRELDMRKLLAQMQDIELDLNPTNDIDTPQDGSV